MIMADLTAIIEANRERLLNLIDLGSLKPALSGRTVLSPFLQSVQMSYTSKADTAKLLDFVCSHGVQAVDALTGALKTEQTHPGHKEALKIILQSSVTDETTEEPSAIADEDPLTEVVATALQDCSAVIEDKMDFNPLMPLFLQKGLINRDTFFTLQGPYVPASQKWQELITPLAKRGLQGINELMDMLQKIPSESHTVIVKELKSKIHQITTTSKGGDTLRNVDVLDATSSFPGKEREPMLPLVTRNGSETSKRIPKKDRVAVIITTETYYDNMDVQNKTALRLSDGKLVVERRNELEQLYEELGCTVINISDILAKGDISSSYIVRDAFASKVTGLCNNNTVVFVSILGLVYPLEEGGIGLLVKDKVAIPRKSQCVTERQLAEGVLALPTQYVTVTIESAMDTRQNMKLYSSESMWQSFCPWNSRTTVLYSRPIPAVASGREDCDVDQLDFGSLTDIFIKALRRRKDSDDNASNKVTHRDIFNIISAQWNPISQTIPCIRGDIDRDIFGHDNHPLPLHFMGIVMAQDQCTILLTVTSSLSGWQQRDGVKLRHLFAPELTFDGTVVQTTPCTATVRVTDEKGWLATLADIKQNDLDDNDDHGAFVCVFKMADKRKSFCVSLDVSEGCRDELLSFLYTSDVFDDVYGYRINVQERDDEFIISSNNVTTVRPVTSLQLAKSLLTVDYTLFYWHQKLLKNSEFFVAFLSKMRVGINERVRRSRPSQATPPPPGRIPCRCSLYPLRGDKPLLSKSGLKEGRFEMNSSVCHKGAVPENALSEFEEEDKFWSPDLSKESPFISVRFPKNVFLKSVEVRGSLLVPTCIPGGYNVYYKSRIALCDGSGNPRKRFEAPSQRNKSVSVKLQSIDQLDSREILPACTGPFTMTITPLTDMGKPIIAFKLLQITNKEEAPVLQYQLDTTCNYAGYIFKQHPSESGIVTLASANDWFTVSCPFTSSLLLLIPANTSLSSLLFNLPDREFVTAESEVPRMVEVDLTTQLPGFIPCVSCFPEKEEFLHLLPCCEVSLQPVPSLQSNVFSQSVCLQMQLHGYEDTSVIEVYDGDRMRALVQHSSTHLLHLTILCIQDTGSIEIIDSCKLLPKESIHNRFIEAFIPNGFTDVRDEYMIIVSSAPLNLHSLVQNGCANYSSLCCYDNKLLDPIEKVTEAPEDWCSYKYRVKVRKRQ